MGNYWLNYGLKDSKQFEVAGNLILKLIRNRVNCFIDVMSEEQLTWNDFNTSVVEFVELVFSEFNERGAFDAYEINVFRSNSLTNISAKINFSSNIPPVILSWDFDLGD